jgi:DNA-binding transcriptional MocR family regulator
VIYVGTFAKTLSASLRSGYIAADPDTIGALADLKMITRANSSGYVEQIIYDLITSGRYRGHLKRLGGRIEVATTAAHHSLAKLGLSVFGHPGGGFYMWCKLPPHIDDKHLSKMAAAQSILLAPGFAFNPEVAPRPPAMRVNIAYAGDARFARFMRENAATVVSKA